MQVINLTGPASNPHTNSRVFRCVCVRVCAQLNEPLHLYLHYQQNRNKSQTNRSEIK